MGESGETGKDRVRGSWGLRWRDERKGRLSREKEQTPNWFSLSYRYLRKGTTIKARDQKQGGGKLLLKKSVLWRRKVGGHQGVEAYPLQVSISPAKRALSKLRGGGGGGKGKRGFRICRISWEGRGKRQAP